jgi:hypothetical protein
MDNKQTLHDCPRCSGTGEAQSGVGFCTYPGCRNGQIDDRPESDDYDVPPRYVFSRYNFGALIMTVGSGKLMMELK